MKFCKALFLIVFIVLNGPVSVAQHLVDATIQTLEQTPDSKETLIQYRKAIKDNRQISQDSRLAYYEKGFSVAQELNLIEEEIEFGFIIGNLYQSIPDSLEVSLKLFLKYLPIAIANNHPRQSQISNMLGNIYMDVNDINQSLHYYSKSIEAAEQFDPKLKTYPLGNISELYSIKEEYQKAIDYTKMAMKYSIQLEEPEKSYNLLYDYYRLGNFYHKLGSPVIALDYYKKAVNQANIHDDSIHKALVYDNISQFYLAQNRLKEAKLYRDSQQIFNPKSRDKNTSVSICFNSANIGLRENNPTHAKKHIDKLSSIQLLSAQKKKYLELVRDYHLHNNDYKSAFAYQDSLIQFQKELSKKQHDQHIVYTEAQFQNQQKLREIDDLKKEDQLNKARLEQQKIFTYAFILFLILSSILAYFFYRQSLEKKKFNTLLTQKVVEQTKELNRSNRELMEMNEELQQFNFIISHDLKEPLRNIVSFSSLALMKAQNPQQKEYLEFVHKNGNQLNNLIDAIKDFRELNDFKLAIENCNLNEMLAEITNDLGILINDKKGYLKYKRLPTILCNKKPLKIVFKNLIENGIKYNQKERPLVSINYQQTPDHHIFFFEDNGIGIEQQYFEKVFTLFKRLNSRKDYDGSGLGIPVSKKLANKMGGDLIIFESILNKGTIFQLTLPKVYKEQTTELIDTENSYS